MKRKQHSSFVVAKSKSVVWFLRFHFYRFVERKENMAQSRDPFQGSLLRTFQGSPFGSTTRELGQVQSIWFGLRIVTYCFPCATI
jgi:hypothetical protein